MSTRSTRQTVTSGAGSGSDDWDEPTHPEGRTPTGKHDLSALARVSAVRDRDEMVRTVYGEGIEEAVRALYVVMRRRGLTTAEMDAIVLAVRREIVGP